MSKDYSLEELEELERKERKTDRWVMTGLIFALGIGAIWINWYYALTKGTYNQFLALFSPGIIIGVIYSILFPNDFTDQNRNKSSLRMWIATITSLLLGFAQLFAFEYVSF